LLIMAMAGGWNKASILGIGRMVHTITLATI
jgi:hypothetical protein